MSVIELFEKNKGWFLAVKNTAALAHYSKKCKYLQNIFKISLKRQVFTKDPFTKYGLGLVLKESLYPLQFQKIINKTNATTPVNKNLRYSSLQRLEHQPKHVGN